MIIFKIDPVLCQKIFIHLVNGLEKAQNIKYPYHYDDLEVQYNNYSKYLQEVQKLDSKKSSLVIPKDTEPSLVGVAVVETHQAAAVSF